MIGKEIFFEVLRALVLFLLLTFVSVVAELDEGISEVGLQEGSLGTLDLKGKIFSKYTISLVSMIVLLDISLISELTTRKRLILLFSAYPMNTSSTFLGSNFLFLGSGIETIAEKFQTLKK